MSGFGKLASRGEGGSNPPKEALKLDDFAPQKNVDRDPLEDEKIADRVAERHKLAEEPVKRVALKRGSVVKDRIMIEGPITTLNRLRQLCNDLGGVPYHQALERLLDRNDRAGGS